MYAYRWRKGQRAKSYLNDQSDYIRELKHEANDLLDKAPQEIREHPQVRGLLKSIEIRESTIEDENRPNAVDYNGALSELLNKLIAILEIHI